MLENKIKVAVIIPAFNCQDTIQRAIESVLNQSYQYFNIYVVNDSSTDGTSNKLKGYEDKENIFIINNEFNKGVAESRNVGLRACSENIVSFLDSDDEWMIDKLEKQMLLIESGKDIVISNYNYVSNEKLIKVCSSYKNISKNIFLKKNFRICFSSLCFNFKKNPIFFESIGHEDFLYIYNLLSTSDGICVIDYILVNQYHSHQSLSSNKIKAARWHYLILQRIIPNVLKRIYYFCFYFINALKFELLKRS